MTTRQFAAPYLRPTDVLIALLLALAFSSQADSRLGAQTQNCVNPDITPDTTAFPQNAQITVNINSNTGQFTPSEYACLQTAFNNWNAANRTNWSGVRFNLNYSQTVLVTTDNNGTPLSGGANVYQVNKSTIGVTDLAATGGQSTTSNRRNAFTNIHPNVTNCDALAQTMAHEIGHVMGLGECGNCTAAQQSVMVGAPCLQWDANHENCLQGDYNNTTYGLTGPTPCDNAKVHESAYPCTNHVPSECEGFGGIWDERSCTCDLPPPGGCPDTCSGPRPLAPTTCFGPVDWCLYPDTGCESGLEAHGRCCCSITSTPIVIDLLGDGFSLTSFESGVNFDLNATGMASGTSWTAANSDDGFLVLDRNGNNVIDSGLELFGNVTPQPEPVPGIARNGFLALAEYDKTAHGGNSDGFIDEHDAVYSLLRFWRDLNHNGISEPAELSGLIDSQVAAISLDFKESRHRDKWGNSFRYRAQVVRSGLRRWAYDVIFLTSSTQMKR